MNMGIFNKLGGVLSAEPEKPKTLAELAKEEVEKKKEELRKKRELLKTKREQAALLVKKIALQKTKFMIGNHIAINGSYRRQILAKKVFGCY